MRRLMLFVGVSQVPDHMGIWTLVCVRSGPYAVYSYGPTVYVRVNILDAEYMHLFLSFIFL